MNTIDHVSAALGRLPHQHREQPHIRGLLRALTRPFAALETAAMQVLLQRTIDLAVGVHLDVIGAKVGRKRAGEADDVYRRVIRAQIAANNSDGLIDDILRVAKLVIYADGARYRFISLGNASYELRVSGVAVAEEVAALTAELVRRATSAGVNGVVITQPSTDEDTFVFGDVPDQVDGAHAAGDTGLSLIGDGLPHWPATGQLSISGGLYTGQAFSYVRLSPISVSIAPALPLAIGGDEIVSRVVAGKGFGDATEIGHPVLTSYTNVGTTGGRLSDAR